MLLESPDAMVSGGAADYRVEAGGARCSGGGRGLRYLLVLFSTLYFSFIYTYFKNQS